MENEMPTLETGMVVVELRTGKPKMGMVMGDVINWYYPEAEFESNRYSWSGSNYRTDKRLKIYAPAKDGYLLPHNWFKNLEQREVVWEKEPEITRINIKLNRELEVYISKDGISNNLSDYSYGLCLIDELAGALKRVKSIPIKTKYSVKEKNTDSRVHPCTIKEVEAKINDGRFIVPDHKDDRRIASLFFFDEQPEGTSYWNMAEKLFIVNIGSEESSQTVHCEGKEFVVTRDTVKVGCQSFPTSKLAELEEAKKKVLGDEK